MKHILPFLALKLSALVLLGTIASASATTITVTNINDSGAGSLRAAITAAGNGDTIAFSNTTAGGLINFYDGTQRAITLSSTLPDIGKNITIAGPGSIIGSAGQRLYLLTVTRSSAGGTPTFRIFTLSTGQSLGPTVSISGLAISNGFATGGFPANLGGGIFNIRGVVTLSNVYVHHNGAGSGGGICNFGGGATLTLSNSEVEANQAVYGGGLLNYTSSGETARLTITTSSVSANLAQDYGGGIANNDGPGGVATLEVSKCNIYSNSGDEGGGIYNLGANATATIKNNTFATNHVTGLGGAILNLVAPMSVTNCTFATNSASTAGGAIYSGNAGNPGSSTLLLQNSTFNNNSAPRASCLMNDIFGGSAATSTIGSSIFNLGNGSGPTLERNGGSLTSQGYNLSSDNGAGLLTAAGDRINTEALLDTLNPNGSTTLTYAPLPGSPAIDQGKDLSGTGMDQRGVTRPYNFNGIADAPGGDGSDIGAVEVAGPSNQQDGSILLVNKETDQNDGACTSTDCTLREAITAANNYNAANNNTGAIIRFSNSSSGGTVNFYIGAHQITLGSALPVLSSNITIGGPAAGLLTVQRSSAAGTPAFRIFTISGNGLTVSLSGLTMQNGSANFGGGISNDSSNLTLTAVTVKGNSATARGGGAYNFGKTLAHGSPGRLTILTGLISGNSAPLGGGIYNDSVDGTDAASVSLNNSGLSANVAFSDGGAINTQGRAGDPIALTLTINNSVLDGNSAANGGGIYSSLGVVTITNATLTGNSVTNRGGAIYNNTPCPSCITVSTISLSNSTLSGNSAQFGGGIYNNGASDPAANDPTTVTLTNSTFNGNSASNSGGGIYNDGPSAQVKIGSTILNKATAAGANLFNTGGASVASQGYNLSSDNAAGTLMAAGDQVNIDPLLGPLGFYGGPTKTHALQPGSPARDKGKDFSGTGLDQRGFGRPYDFGSVTNAPGGDASDIGACEDHDVVQAPAGFEVNTAADWNDGVCGEADCTLREAINAANAYAGMAVITFNMPGNAPHTIDLGAVTDTTSGPSALLLQGNMTIQGPGANLLTLRRSGSGDSRIFRVVAGKAVTISGLTLTNGYLTSDAGGAIYNQGTLTLQACSLTGNYANSAGGIRTDGSLILDRCTVSGNSSYAGGGIMSQTNLIGLTTIIRNSTISGNTAANFGGGLENVIGLTQILNSTITRNTAPEGGGGGVYSHFANNTRTEVHDSIIAQNSSTDMDQVPGASSYSSGGHNLVGYGGGVGAFTASGDTRFVTNPKLGPLANNGGGTYTHALLLGSPAINTGATANVTTDQRGLLRQSGGAVDIGAYELQPESYAFWSSYIFPTTTPANLLAADADADGDGIPNGLEQVLGSNPNARNALSSLLQYEIQGNYLVLQFTRSIYVDPAKVFAEQSLTLQSQSWNGTGITYDDMGPANSTAELIQALIPIDGAPKKFGRLRFTP